MIDNPHQKCINIINICFETHIRYSVACVRHLLAPTSNSIDSSCVNCCSLVWKTLDIMLSAIQLSWRCALSMSSKWPNNWNFLCALYSITVGKRSNARTCCERWLIIVNTNFQLIFVRLTHDCPTFGPWKLISCAIFLHLINYCWIGWVHVNKWTFCGFTSLVYYRLIMAEKKNGSILANNFFGSYIWCGAHRNWNNEQLVF